MIILKENSRGFFNFGCNCSTVTRLVNNECEYRKRVSRKARRSETKQGKLNTASPLPEEVRQGRCSGAGLTENCIGICPGLEKEISDITFKRKLHRIQRL